MAFTETDWAEKRKNGFVRYLLVYGIFYTGGPFAVLMQIAGYFFMADANQTFPDYFVSARTWFTFFAHAVLFGGIMGSLSWFLNENAFKSAHNTKE